MRNFVFLAFLSPGLSGCGKFLYGEGNEIGVHQGAPLYRSTCTVPVGLLAQGHYGECEMPARLRCGRDNYTPVNVERSNRRRITVHGPNYIRRFTGESVKFDFVCTA